jgi:3',5'-cyclic AMP phosphodiesterase CpdA
MIEFIPLTQNDKQGGFRLAHISDPHLSNLNAISWRELLNKRILGFLSWRLSRRHIHQTEVLNKLIEKLDDEDAQHLLISGDLTHIGTPSEFQQVKQWLEELGSGKDITVIPGNHDAYIETPKSQTNNLWSNYMESDSEFSSDAVEFPSLRSRGPLAIIGVSSAVPTAPFFATGRIGKLQMERLQKYLEITKERGLFRVVALHHGPLADSNKFRKRLVDAKQFRETIREFGAELIVHGHGHYPVEDSLKTNGIEIPVVGAPSASLLSGSKIKRSGYNIYEVKSHQQLWEMKMQAFGYNVDSEKYILQKEKTFSLPRN